MGKLFKETLTFSLFGLLLLSSSALKAGDSILVTTESKSETQSIRCSAIYFVLTSVEDARLSESFTGISTGFSNIYAYERKKRTLTGLTNADVLARRDVTLGELSSTYKNNPPAIMDEVAMCAAWWKTLGDEKTTTAKAPTKEQLASIKQEYAKAVYHAFTIWIEGGSKTAEDIKRQLRESLSK